LSRQRVFCRVRESLKREGKGRRCCKRGTGKGVQGEKGSNPKEREGKKVTGRKNRGEIEEGGERALFKKNRRIDFHRGKSNNN